MRIKRIDLNDEEMPESVIVQMSTAEAAYIAVLLGKQNGITSSKVMANGAALNNQIYDCLSGALFNKYWEDGIHSFRYTDTDTETAE